MSKRIDEVFSDCRLSGGITTALVEKVTIFKESKTLEMVISSDNYIENGQVESLNSFIKERFSLVDSRIIINYTNGDDSLPIEDEIGNIISSICDESPSLRLLCQTVTMRLRIGSSNSTSGCLQQSF